MVFWLGILFAGAFAWFGIKKGFYEAWAMLFNILIAIYLAVFLGPTIANSVSASSNTAYNNALCMTATAVVSFLILYGISYILLIGQFTLQFPKIFDTFGTGLLGFLAGLLVWGFVSLLINVTPISQNTFVKGIGFGSQSPQSNASYLSRWCNLVNAVVSKSDHKLSTEEAISRLLKKLEVKPRVRTAKETEPAEPVEPAGPNEVEIITTELERLGPPPEAGDEDI